jgi:hypothetical protein
LKKEKARAKPAPFTFFKNNLALKKKTHKRFV